MTLPPAPDNSTPPSAVPPPAAPAYSAAPPAPYGPPAVATVPGRTLGIVALVVAIFFNVIGLILGIVALVQSKKAGAKNGFAVAAIIVGAVLFVVGIIVAIVVLSVVFGATAALCSELGSGTHVLSGTSTITCP